MFRSSPSKYPLLQQMRQESPVSRAFRTMRTYLNYAEGVQEAKVILMASSVPREGKTFLVVNLAIAYAMEGKRVLLIDGNFRSPKIHEIFMKSNRFGLAHALMMGSGFNETVLETDIANLFIIPSGQIVRDATELLASPALDQWIRDLRSDFDVILIDTPPATDFADAKVWVRVSDGVLFAVRAGKVKSKVLSRVKGDFEDVGARIFGVILNDAERDRIYGLAVEETRIR